MDVTLVWRTRWAEQTAAAALGFTAVAAESVLLRAAMALINGSEISIGLVLAVWLLWTSLGSALGSRLARRTRHPRAQVAALALVMGIGLCLAVCGLHLCRLAWAATPGEMLGPDKMLLAALVCLSLFCLAAGACFAALTQMARAGAASAGAAAGRIYLLEAAGSAAGGLVTGLLLVRVFTPLQVAALLLAANAVLACLLVQHPRDSEIQAAPWLPQARHPRDSPIQARPWVPQVPRIWGPGKPRKHQVPTLLARWTPLRLAAIVLAGAALAAFLIAGAAPRAERALLAREWPGFTIVDTRESLYGSLMVTEAGGMRSLYENRVLTANSPDPEAAEEAVHFALLEHPAPRRVLLIGGAAAGAVAEALKHPTVERVDLVELDPALLRMVHEHLKDAGRAVFHDRRVKVHLADGRQFVAASREQFDAILLIGPGPETAALNRFYTVEFFRSARARLAPAGVFSFAVPSEEEALTPELRAFLQSMNATLGAVFPAVLAIPGDTMHFVAATQTGVLTDRAEVLAARLKERGLQTQYVREYFLPFRMAPERMESARAALAADAATRVNRDLQPIAYYENAVLWSGQFGSPFARWMQSAARIPFAWALAAAALAALLLALIGWSRPRRAAIVCMGSTGFTLMALQVFLLLLFQAVRGYVYTELTLLVGMTMAGIALGGWWGLRRPAASAVSTEFGNPSQTMGAPGSASPGFGNPSKTMGSPVSAFTGVGNPGKTMGAVSAGYANPSRTMGAPGPSHLGTWESTKASAPGNRIVRVQAALACSLPLLMAVAAALRTVEGSSAAAPFVRFLFLALAALAGALGGVQFPRLSDLSLSAHPGAGAALYAIDLAGGCAAALLVSLYLIPVFGFWTSAWLCALLSAGPTVAAMRLPSACK